MKQYLKRIIQKFLEQLAKHKKLIVIFFIIVIDHLINFPQILLGNLHLHPTQGIDHLDHIGKVDHQYRSLICDKGFMSKQ